MRFSFTIYSTARLKTEEYTELCELMFLLWICWTCQTPSMLTLMNFMSMVSSSRLANIVLSSLIETFSPLGPSFPSARKKMKQVFLKIYSNCLMEVQFHTTPVVPTKLQGQMRTDVSRSAYPAEFWQCVWTGTILQLQSRFLVFSRSAQGVSKTNLESCPQVLYHAETSPSGPTPTPVAGPHVTQSPDHIAMNRHMRPLCLS